MGKRDFYIRGNHNVICDRCGAKFKASECKMEWDHLFVCGDCWEVRHPQDYLKGRKDDPRVEIARPRGTTRFITNQILPEDL